MDERLRPQTYFRTQRRLNTHIASYLVDTIIRSYPMVGSLALYPKDAKQDPMMYGAEFGVVFMAKGPSTASIQ